MTYLSAPPYQIHTWEHIGYPVHAHFYTRSTLTINDRFKRDEPVFYHLAASSFT